jgi:hypothetical protein
MLHKTVVHVEGKAALGSSLCVHPSTAALPPSDAANLVEVEISTFHE